MTNYLFVVPVSSIVSTATLCLPDSLTILSLVYGSHDSPANTETGYKLAVFIGFVDKRCEIKIT